MRTFMEGMLLPFKFVFAAVSWLGRGVWIGLRAYEALVSGLGKPWAGMVHSTVFVSLGQGLIWLIFR